MSSFLVFDHKTNYCGMNKLIPGARLTTFTIWHCKHTWRNFILITWKNNILYLRHILHTSKKTDYQQRHISWTPVFVADENLRAGNHYYSNPKVKLNAPACWKEIVDQAQLEQAPPPPPPPAATGPTVFDV